MLSVPHMIVIFVVVLIVFGPKKLPELARGLGKLMAEFRKASTDFRSAFEQEMRDLERQAMQAERKKQADAAAKTAAEQTAVGGEPANIPSGEQEQAPAERPSESGVPESHEIAPVIAPVPEAVARSTESTPAGETERGGAPHTPSDGDGLGGSAPSADANDLAHDLQRPA